MAWITPVTNRTTGAIHTATDQNRITGNLDYLTTVLAEHSLYSGAVVSKTSYTINDYISTEEWANLLEVLDDLQEALSLSATEAASDAMTYQNMNVVESLTLQIYNQAQLVLKQGNLNHYPGQGFYSRADDGAIYAGGLL